MVALLAQDLTSVSGRIPTGAISTQWGAYKGITAKRELTAGASRSDAGPSPASAAGQDDEGSKHHTKIRRKQWLHTAVDLVPDGSNAYICRYCGTVLASQNISVRKKVWPLVKI